MASGGGAMPVTVLLVEDDEQVRRLISGLLNSNGFRVLEAATGAEGLQVGLQHADEIDVLLSDMLLPEISGYDVARQLRERHPGLQIILMTGYVEGEIVQNSMRELGASFLDKPFQPGELLARVREAASKVRNTASSSSSASQRE